MADTHDVREAKSGCEPGYRIDYWEARAEEAAAIAAWARAGGGL